MRRSVHRFLLPSLASLAAVTLVFACGSQEVNIPDAPRPEGGTGRDSASPDSAAPDTSAPDARPDVVVVCPDVLPVDETGVFVAPGGTNNAACGTRAKPCLSPSVGITHAVAASKAKVFLARGTYTERVVLAAGVELVGGWDVPAGSTTWKRACVTPDQVVILRGPPAQSLTVEARNLGGEARLTSLRVESKLPAQVTPGESLYGIVAVGSTTTLVTTDVNVEVGNGGAGAAPAKSGNGAAGVGTCPPAPVAAPGTAGTAGSGAPTGGFDNTGYVPSAATDGALGTAGSNGIQGGVGTCVTCGSCGVFPLCDFIADATPPVCGKDGASGCGGGPGVPGVAAASGGSSIGVYAWDATVTINGGKVKSGDGGNGGAGGAGGNGGAAASGAAGAAAAPCVTSCEADNVNLKCVGKKTAGLGGAAGGAGAVGGAGGAGGGGAGGSSFGAYQGGLGFVNPIGASYAHGKAGAGGGVGPAAGAAGIAADHVP